MPRCKNGGGWGERSISKEERNNWTKQPEAETNQASSMNEAESHYCESIIKKNENSITWSEK